MKKYILGLSIFVLVFTASFGAYQKASAFPIELYKACVWACTTPNGDFPMIDMDCVRSCLVNGGTTSMASPGSGSGNMGSKITSLPGKGTGSMPLNSFKQNLGIGSSGNNVKAFQTLLIKNGFLSGKADGKYGKNTANAVNKLQEKFGFPMTGKLDPQTRSLLNLMPVGISLKSGVGPNKVGVGTYKAPGLLKKSLSVNTPTASCNPGDAPSVTITSPNGGEVYTAGQQINVTWTSCNISATDNVDVRLIPDGTFSLNMNLNLLIVQNTGSTTYTIPSNQAFINGGVTLGTHFKILMLHSVGGGSMISNAEDWSDNLFTINGGGNSTDFPVVTTDSATFITSQSAVLTGTAVSNIKPTAEHWFEYNTNSAVGGPGTTTTAMIPAVVGQFSNFIGSLSPLTNYYYRACVRNTSTIGTSCGSILSFQTLGSNSTACTSTSTPSITVTSPNGGETFIAGQQINVTWTSCNMQANSFFMVNLDDLNSGSHWVLNVGNNGPFNTPNTGSATFILPNSQQWPQMTYGNNFKVTIWDSSTYLNIHDASDNLFTINQIPQTACTLQIQTDPSNPLAQTVPPNTPHFLFETVDLTAVGCDVNVPALGVNIGGTISPLSSISNLNLFYSSPQLNIELGTASSAPALINFVNGSLIISNGTTKKLKLYADIGSATPGQTVSFGIGSNTGAQPTNNQTGASLPVVGSVNGNLMTIGGGMTQACTSNSTPSITVTSPNGGGTYNPGQQIEVTWQTCNIPSNTLVNVSLQGDSGVNSAYNFFTGTPNSGSIIVTLPTQSQWANLQYGLHYTMLVAAPGLYDYSDNLFTIQQ